MGATALPIVLLVLLLLVSWRIVFTFNRDLIRAKAWGELLRRSLPFAALTLMALTIVPVQSLKEDWAITTWALGSAIAVISGNLLAMPLGERRANKAFRRGDYQRSVAEYRRLVEKTPLARHHSFLSAALGANGEHEKSLEASTRAIELDPQYGIAYYNRALVLRQMGKKSRARKDLERALDSDLPRRFRRPIGKLIEGLR